MKYIITLVFIITNLIYSNNTFYNRDFAKSYYNGKPSRDYETAFNNFINKSAFDDDGNHYLTVRTNDKYLLKDFGFENLEGENFTLFQKCNQYGDVIWSKLFESPLTADIYVFDDLIYLWRSYISYEVESPNNGSVLEIYNKNGDLLNQKYQFAKLSIYRAKLIKSGEFIYASDQISGYFSDDEFLGNYNKDSLDNDVYVCKYDKNLNLIWSYVIGDIGFEGAYFLDVDNYGNIYQLGIADGIGSVSTPNSYQENNSETTKQRYDMLLTKLNSNGELEWSTYIGCGGYNEYPRNFQIINDKLYIQSNIEGYYTGNNNPKYYCIDNSEGKPINYGVINLKFDLDGNFELAKLIGSDSTRINLSRNEKIKSKEKNIFSFFNDEGNILKTRSQISHPFIPQSNQIFCKMDTNFNIIQSYSFIYNAGEKVGLNFIYYQNDDIYINVSGSTNNNDYLFLTDEKYLTFSNSNYNAFHKYTLENKEDNKYDYKLNQDNYELDDSLFVLNLGLDTLQYFHEESNKWQSINNFKFNEEGNFNFRVKYRDSNKFSLNHFALHKDSINFDHSSILEGNKIYSINQIDRYSKTYSMTTVDLNKYPNKDCFINYGNLSYIDGFDIDTLQFNFKKILENYKFNQGSNTPLNYYYLENDFYHINRFNNSIVINYKKKNIIDTLIGEKILTIRDSIIYVLEGYDDVYELSSYNHNSEKNILNLDKIRYNDKDSQCVNIRISSEILFASYQSAEYSREVIGYSLEDIEKGIFEELLRFDTTRVESISPYFTHNVFSLETKDNSTSRHPYNLLMRINFTNFNNYKDTTYKKYDQIIIDKNNNSFIKKYPRDHNHNNNHYIYVNKDDSLNKFYYFNPINIYSRPQDNITINELWLGEVEVGEALNNSIDSLILNTGETELNIQKIELTDTLFRVDYEKNIVLLPQKRLITDFIFQSNETGTFYSNINILINDKEYQSRIGAEVSKCYLDFVDSVYIGSVIQDSLITKNEIVLSNNTCFLGIELDSIYLVNTEYFSFVNLENNYDINQVIKLDINFESKEVGVKSTELISEFMDEVYTTILLAEVEERVEPIVYKDSIKIYNNYIDDGTLYFYFENSEPNFINIEVYDLLGRKYINEFNRNYEIGNREEKFNISNLAIEKYFIKLKTKDSEMLFPIIKVK
jgi:hypothetical protein